MNHERVADWLTAMPTYRQSLGRLIARDSSGRLAHCGIGTACARAVHDPDSGITVGTRTFPWGTVPAFVVDTAQPARRHYAVYEALAQWLGVDILEVRVRLADLPPFLASAIGFYLPLRHADIGWVLWELNDHLVPLHLQRDALRVTLGVDADQVTEPARVGA